MSTKPLPERQYWAAATERPAGEVASIPTPLLRRGQTFAIVGGKLAAALVQPIMYAGFEMAALDGKHPLLADIPAEAAEYEAYGNGYGEIDSARAFRQLVERAARTFMPREDRWSEDGRVVDPFRPNLTYAATSDREFDVLAERHLNAVRSAFRRARVVLVMLSTSEIWEAIDDGAVYPHWASVGASRFDPAKHRVRTLTVEETVADLDAAVSALRGINPAVEIVLMVSPEPQLATALPVHVLAAATLGKAILRIAAETVARADGVHYFPAFEIAALAAPGKAYGPDGRPPHAAVVAVADALLEISEGGRVSYDGAAAPITVLRIDEAEQPAQAPAQATSRAPRRSPGVQASAVDAYSEAAAAEKAEKDAARALKRAAREAVGEVAEPKVSKHAQKVAEREARQKAKAEAKTAERVAKAAPSEQESSAETRDQKLAERKARLTAKAAAREAKRASKPEADAQAGMAVSDTSPPRRRRDRAGETSTGAADTVEERPTKPRRGGRERVTPPTPTAPAATTETAGSGPLRAGRGRREKIAVPNPAPQSADAQTPDASSTSEKRVRRERKPKG